MALFGAQALRKGSEKRPQVRFPPWHDIDDEEKATHDEDHKDDKDDKDENEDEFEDHKW